MTRLGSSGYSQNASAGDTVVTSIAGSTVGTRSVVSMIGRPAEGREVIDDTGGVPDRSAGAKPEAEIGAQIQAAGATDPALRPGCERAAATSGSTSSANAAQQRRLRERFAHRLPGPAAKSTRTTAAAGGLLFVLDRDGTAAQHAQKHRQLERTADGLETMREDARFVVAKQVAATASRCRPPPSADRPSRWSRPAPVTSQRPTPCRRMVIRERVDALTARPTAPAR